MTRVQTMCILLFSAACSAFASGVSEEPAFEHPRIDSIVVRAEFLDVDVAGSSADEASMRADIPQESLFDSPGVKVKHRVSGSQLDIWVERNTGGFFDWGRGRLELRVLPGTRMLIETISGTIDVHDVDSERLQVKSISGDISIRDVSGAVNVQSVTGRISIGDLEGTLHAKTVSAPIDCNRIVLTDQSAVWSVSGDIDIGFAMSLDDLRFELSSESGQITIGSLRTGGSLRMGKGRILVTGRTVSGSQLWRQLRASSFSAPDP